MDRQIVTRLLDHGMAYRQGIDRGWVAFPHISSCFSYLKHPLPPTHPPVLREVLEGCFRSVFGAPRLLWTWSVKGESRQSCRFTDLTYNPSSSSTFVVDRFTRQIYPGSTLPSRIRAHWSNRFSDCQLTRIASQV